MMNAGLSMGEHWVYSVPDTHWPAQKAEGRAMSDVYPVTDDEMEAAVDALDNALAGVWSLTACVHAVLGAVHNTRSGGAEHERR